MEREEDIPALIYEARPVVRSRCPRRHCGAMASMQQLSASLYLRNPMASVRHALVLSSPSLLSKPYGKQAVCKRSCPRAYTLNAIKSKLQCLSLAEGALKVQQMVACQG